MNATSRCRIGIYLAMVATCDLGGEALSATVKNVPLPRPRPAINTAKQAIAPGATTALQPKTTPLPQKRPPANRAGLSSFAQANVGLHGAIFESRSFFKPLARPTSGPFAIAPTAATSPADIAAVKRVIEASRKGKEADANAAEASISDPVARKLAEWVILRSDNTNPTFQRYAAFVQANPSWPHSPLFRRRAENALWNDGVDDGMVRAFFAKQQPATAKGRFMLARTLLAQGDREGAAALVRQAWRNDEFSAEVEKRVLEMFGGMLSAADHKVRMEQRFYADDVAAGQRAADRLGGNEPAIGRARAAVLRKASNAKALLDAVPTAAQSDPGYIFARVQWLRQNNKAEEAGKLILTAPKNPDALVNLDQWWLERRLLVRKLLDEHD
ncbi:MAG TPA: lytic transglycosylase domain-containing protein, partial [Pseudolabrys sp.]